MMKKRVKRGGTAYEPERLRRIRVIVKGFPKRATQSVVALAILLCVLLFFAILPGKTLAAGTSNSDFEIDSNGVLTKYNGEGGDVVIPDGVKSIGERAFSFCR